jgi:hypothetical protein
MSEIYSDGFPMEESLCKNCVFRFSIVLTPLDPESFGLTEEDITIMGVSEDEDINIERHTCLISNTDMDYLVKRCSHFKEAGVDCSFFSTNPYK